MDNNFDYIEQANVTMSPAYHAGVPVGFIGAGLQEFCAVGCALDDVKKRIFYNRNIPKLEATITWMRQDVTTRNVQEELEGLKDVNFELLLPGRPDDARNIFHGILGAITEAAEMAKAILEALENGTPLDLTNLFEEVGDNQWYMAAILRAMGKTFDECHRTNIQKLRARFPNNFTEYDANNRNLEAERKVLEQGPAWPTEKPVAAIENWTLTKIAIFGDVVSHPKLGDMMGVQTSAPIYTKPMDQYVQGDRVETQNTVYVLGNPCVR